MKRKEECQLHSKTKKTVNRTLLSLIFLGLLLVLWHVWIHHREAMFFSFFSEIRILFTGRAGIFMELKEVFLYFFIGILIAGYIRTYKLHIRLRKILTRFGVFSIFLSAFIGVFSPLCSCGILTTVVALLAAGLPLAPAMALLVSSPLMSPTAFFLTLNDLGVQWTIVRVITAFLMGVLAGGITHWLSKRGFEDSGLFLEQIPDGDFHDHDYPDERLRCTCNEKFSNKIARKTKNKFIIYWAKTYEMLWLIGKYVLVGIIVGCIIERYIPSSYIYNLFGQGGKLSPVWVTFGSIPIFLHQISASSILFHIKASLSGIIDNRAALAFLIGGPVTAIPAMILLWSMFKKKVFVLYLSISIIGTLFFSYTLGNFLFVPHVNLQSPMLSNVSSLAGGKSAIISKSNDLIQIAVAPDKKPIVAYSEAYIEGTEGGIVFDAGWSRFLNDSLKIEGNKEYIKNIALWLKETSNHAEGNRILVYNTYVDRGMNNQFFQEGLQSILSEEAKFEVDIFERSAVPFLTKQILEDYDQLWILSGQVDDVPFSSDEIADVYAFHDSGKSLLIVAGPQDGTNGDWTGAANQVAQKYGVRFNNVTILQDEVPISVVNHLCKGAFRGLLPYFGWLKWLRK